MKIGVAIWPKSDAEWLELGLNSLSDVKVIRIEDCDLDLPPFFELLLVDGDNPGPRFIPFFRNFQSIHGHKPLIILGQPSSPSLMLLDWEPGLTLFVAKPYKIEDVIRTVSQKLRDSAAHHKPASTDTTPEPSSVSKTSKSLGYLSTLRLSDLIQMLCLSNWTGKIEITHLAGNESGEIYLNVGVLIHARQDKYDGEQAIYRMLTWGRCEFQFLEEHPLVVQSIQAHWQEVMLEGARLIDIARAV